MGIYTPRKVPQVLTAAWLNQELTAIETAHNSHAKENFPDKCIPLAALQGQHNYWCHVLLPENLNTGDLEYYMVPTECTLVKYTACAAACDGSSTFALNYYPVSSAGVPDSAVSILGATSFVSANNVVSGTLNVSLSPGYVIELVTVDPGTALTRATICLTFKSHHTS